MYAPGDADAAAASNCGSPTERLTALCSRIVAAALFTSLLACGSADDTRNGEPGSTRHDTGRLSSDQSIILATTTSTHDSGLLDSRLPLFRRETGIDVKVIAVGTGAALDMAQRGNADAVLAHAPASEREYIATGDLTGGRLVMHNDFLIVAPPDDPAKISGRASLAEAIRAIARSGPFISRGDGSGTEKMELELWKLAVVEPAKVPRREATGQGMGATPNVANQRRAYTLTDRATYLALRPRLSLVPLYQGDPKLFNVYHAYVVNPAKHAGVKAHAAAQFVAFLVSPATQRAIGAFGRSRFGEPLFIPDAGTDSARLGLRETPSDSSMSDTIDAFREALRLLFGGNPAAYSIIARTLVVSGSATLIAMMAGVPLGYLVARARFPGRTFLLSAVNTGMGIPPVVVGLVVWLLLARSGPLGSLELIYTKRAKVIAQVIIALPLIVGFTAASVQALPARLRTS